MDQLMLKKAADDLEHERKRKEELKQKVFQQKKFQDQMLSEA